METLYRLPISSPFWETNDGYMESESSGYFPYAVCIGELSARQC